MNGLGRQRQCLPAEQRADVLCVLFFIVQHNKDNIFLLYNNDKVR